jgi:hypothetical protein
VVARDAALASPGDGLRVLRVDGGDLLQQGGPVGPVVGGRRVDRRAQDGHDVYPSSLAASPVRISVVPPPMPMMRMSRYCRSTSTPRM